MKLKDKVKPAVPPMEAGVYMAVCVVVADLGDQYSKKYKKSSRKVVFSFDIPSETIEIDGEQKPRQLSKRCTFSVSKKGTLNKMLNAWMNANMSEQELGELDLFSLIGRGCQIRVTVSEDGAHNNIEDVMALPKGMPAPQSDTAPITYDIDEDGFTGEKWDALPTWMREAIEKSDQYQQDPPDKPLDMPVESTAQEGGVPDLTFRSLASSSKGNAYLVSDGETVLLLECGLPYKKLAEKSGFTLMNTAACFVTHEHKDHSHAAEQLVKRGVPVFMSEGTARALELWDAEIIEPNVPIMVGAFRVMAFRVAHDAADPVGYLIDDTRTGERLMFAADTRSLSYIVPRLTYIAVECNYEESLLAASQRIPESLKNRIRHSHFEVEDVIRWLKKQDLSHALTIYLLHLSAGNSRAAAWQTRFVREFPGVEIQICKE